MKAYKGFTPNEDGTLECCEFIYEPNKTHTRERGFRVYGELHDVWADYPNDGESVFYEVECGGEIKKVDEEFEYAPSAFECSEITLLKKVDTSNVAIFDWASPFNEEYALVKSNDKGWNWINRNGEIAFPEQWYDDAWVFEDGYALVELKGKYYKLRKDGVLCDYRTKQPIIKANE